MKATKKWIMPTVFVLCASIAAAQDVEQQPVNAPVPVRKWTFAFQPAYIFQTAVRIDVERRFKTTPGWLQMGATIYPFTYREAPKEWGWKFGWIFGDPYSSMWGYGLNVNYKYFIHRLLYVAGGPAYHYFDVKYFGDQWINFTEDGLTYHKNKYGLNGQQIHRLGVNAYFGYQRISRRSSLFDAYIGIGYRYGIHRHNHLKAFDSSRLSLGSSGFRFLIGVRLGVGM
ncbi:MAG: hypothetical protein LBS03_09105 [Bacteroidales bacterium]|jgi:hypothetical protein|nr:hypothetical protein [Bacteroidales bacterium]